ncbi:ferritin-like domain-containing protein [Marinimicrobium alkaliphilum]|uniref:ferritin-like domain-containing protein n=1 Tax=Marinimicrobium alkaliphilum TaxID=2202654 RepID=UPI000DBACB7B|nr:ferritin-like domain-containing protein [Marinimicrobium alkaliphilum]
MKKTPYIKNQLHELLHQALETERGGIRIYEAALLCAKNDDLKNEWEEYLEETRTHERVLLDVFKELELDPDTITPGQEVVAHIGDALVEAIEMARSQDNATAAQLVACECVVLAETKDHQNWELIGHLAEHGQGKETGALKTAVEAIGEEEEHHLYHTKGFTRELWIESFGLPAVLPPPEEVKNVETAIGAERAGNQRNNMLRREGDRHAGH